MFNIFICHKHIIIKNKISPGKGQRVHDINGLQRCTNEGISLIEFLWTCTLYIICMGKYIEGKHRWKKKSFRTLYRVCHRHYYLSSSAKWSRKITIERRQFKRIIEPCPFFKLCNRQISDAIKLLKKKKRKQKPLETSRAWLCVLQTMNLNITLVQGDKINFNYNQLSYKYIFLRLSVLILYLNCLTICYSFYKIFSE